MIALLPDLGFPHEHNGALRAFERFCTVLCPSAVIQTGRLFASPHPARPDLERAARWLHSLGDRTSVIMVAEAVQALLASEVIRTAGVHNAITAQTEYRLDCGWTVHTGGSSTSSTAGFPGGAAIALAHRRQTNVVCGHTRLRGIVTEIRETDSAPVELWGMEIGHLHADPTRAESLGFGVLLIDTATDRVRPALVRVGRRGVIRYGGARFNP